MSDKPQYTYTDKTEFQIPEYGKSFNGHRNIYAYENEELRIKRKYSHEKQDSPIKRKHSHKKQDLPTKLQYTEPLKLNYTDNNNFAKIDSVNSVQEFKPEEIVRKAVASDNTFYSGNETNNVLSKPSVTKRPVRELSVLADRILRSVDIILHEGNLYYYDGKIYRLIDNDSELLSLIRYRVDPTVFNIGSLKVIKDLYAFLKSDCSLEPRDYSRKLRMSQYLITFEDCIYDLRSSQKLDFSKDYLTFNMFKAKFKRNPNPKAFLKFVNDCADGDDEIKTRIIQTIGYILSPINEGKVFFVWGTAQNSGKSTLGKLLEYLLGEEQVCYITPEAMQQKFGLGYIQGKLLCMSMDLPKGNFTANMASAIKQITGGYKIHTEKKYERPQDIRSNMRFVFASNFPVKVAKSCDDDAFWNRMVIVPFLHSVSKKNSDFGLLDKLEKEKSDIISYCLQSVEDLIDNNYIFDYCEEAEIMKEQWRYGSACMENSIQEFAEAYTEFTGLSSDYVYTRDLFAQYKNFCMQSNLTNATYNTFKNWFAYNGCEHKRIHRKQSENAKSGLTGIKMKQGGIFND